MQVVHGNHEILPFVGWKLAFIKSARKLRLLVRWKAREAFQRAGCRATHPQQTRIRPSTSREFLHDSTFRLAVGWTLQDWPGARADRAVALRPELLPAGAL